MIRKAAKKFILILILTLACVALAIPVEAHDREQHNADLESVLFGDETYKSTHPEVKDKIQAIEDAIYLCIDQYNGGGTAELRNLKERDIPGIPKAIDDIDFTGNYAHREKTHRGWNVNYSKEVHWPVRQKILRNTLEKEIFLSVKKPLSWFPWLSNLIYGKDDYMQQCESFCVLIYNIHIIGDHIESMIVFL